MKLKRWLEIKGKTPRDFWRDFMKVDEKHPSKSAIYNWVNEEKKPRDNRIKQIHQMTGGAVTRKDWK